MNTQKTFKANTTHNTQDNNARGCADWQHDQQKREERKQHKGLRLQRKTRKIMWMVGE